MAAEFARGWATFLRLLVCAWATAGVAARAAADGPAEPVVLNDDAAWCWFQDERALVHGSTLIVGSVANGTNDQLRRGDIEVVAYDLATGNITRTELHDQLEADDHAAPALWLSPDGRLLAVYSKHGSENRFYVRSARGPDLAGDWLPSTSFVPSDRSRITYSNLLYLSSENAGQGRLYNFFRGLDASFKPSYACSDDRGATWQTGNVVIDVPAEVRHRPYAKYAGNGRDTIHIAYTEGHPRNFDNSIYHVYYRAGQLHRSDGSVIGPLTAGLQRPEQGTCVFHGDAQHVAWISDLHLSPDGRPYLVYSVQKDSAGLAATDERLGQDHRYRYARWDGSRWRDAAIGYAGSRLYPGEDDYTGNICLDPDRLDTVYLSTNADPLTGQPLVSAADGRRHYEIYRARTADGGQTWDFVPITRDSRRDNLRPMVPAWDQQRTALLWFRGTYTTYRKYDTQAVVLVLDDTR